MSFKLIVFDSRPTSLIAVLCFLIHFQDLQSVKKSIVLMMKTPSLLVLGTIFNTLVNTPTVASTFSAEPIYEAIVTNEIQIPTTTSLNGFDVSDLYYPESSNPDKTFPLAIMLQGALVDKADYSSFATRVASYGFLVAVPNHLRNISSDLPPGLFPTQEVVNDVLNFMEEENANNTKSAYQSILLV